MSEKHAFAPKPDQPDECSICDVELCRHNYYAYANPAAPPPEPTAGSDTPWTFESWSSGWVALDKDGEVVARGREAFIKRIVAAVNAEIPLTRAALDIARLQSRLREVEQERDTLKDALARLEQTWRERSEIVEHTSGLLQACHIRACAKELAALRARGETRGEPSDAQMSCGFALYGEPALCTCGTCPSDVGK